MIAREWLCQDCLQVTAVDSIDDPDQTCECGGDLCWCAECSALAEVTKAIGGRENTAARIELVKAAGLGAMLRADAMTIDPDDDARVRRRGSVLEPMRVRVQLADRRGRRCAFINLGGREEAMANNRDRYDRGDRDRGGGGGGSSETDTRWVLAGVAWPFKEGKEGFNIETDWPIKQGARLQLTPPRDEGNNRPWNLYELREKPKRDNQGR